MIELRELLEIIHNNQLTRIEDENGSLSEGKVKDILADDYIQEWMDSEVSEIKFDYKADLVTVVVED